jgi:hypothetical protein
MCFLASDASSEIEYLVKGTSSNGCDEYLTVAECEEFATSGTLDWEGEEEASSDYPTGCYIYDNVYLYFNPTTAGSGNNDSQQVCKKTGDNIFFIFKTKSRYPSGCLCHNSTLMMPR